MVMKSFHNNIFIKNKYISRVKHHIDADNLVRGLGWKDGKGCAVGCTLENYDHQSYEIELGIPEWLARVEDALFEGMSIEKSKRWPLIFLETINVGIDLEKARTPFLIVVLERSIESMHLSKFDEHEFSDVRNAIDQSTLAIQNIIDLHKSGSIAEGAAMITTYGAGSAAWGIAEGSAAENAACGAACGARSAAWSVTENHAITTAWSVRCAAWSAAWSARSSAFGAMSTESTRSAAWSAAANAAYDYFADSLLSILENIK